MNRLFLPSEFKLASDAEFSFTGVANRAGIVDRGNDRVVTGAFSETLRTRGPRRPLLWSHDPKEPLGYVELAEDSRGLRVVKGQLVPEVQRAREVFALLKVGALNGLSIGYEAKRSRPASGGVRELLEVDLLEVSIVMEPMNQDSRITDVKSDDARELVHGLRKLRTRIEADYVTAVLRNMVADARRS